METEHLWTDLFEACNERDINKAFAAIKGLGKSALPQMMTTKQAAAYLGVGESSLNQARSFGYFGVNKTQTGPPYTKIGKLVRYKAEDLDKWLEGFKRG